MNDSTLKPQKHSRRWVFKFTLRTLLILTSGVAIWLGFIANAALQQKSAVAALIKAGIAVHYDYQYEVLTQSDLTFPEGHRARRFYRNNFTNHLPVPSAPHWLRRMTGDEYFQTITAVSIYDNFRTDLWASGYRSYIDASFPHLRRLPHLKDIYLHQPRDHADSPIFTEVKELLEREFPQAKVTEIGFVSIR